VPAGWRRDVLSAKSHISGDNAGQKAPVHVIGLEIAVGIGDADDAADGLRNGTPHDQDVLRPARLLAAALGAPPNILRAPAAPPHRDRGLDDRRIRQITIAIVRVAFV
jgi:hypothetical protein